jgi:hypothetical protein
MAGKKQKNTPTPFSLRFTFEERAQLDKQAAGMALGTYIKWRVLNPDTPPPRTRGKFPVKDHKAIAKVLAKLGQSRIANSLNQLAKLAHTGSLPMTPETDEFIRLAYLEIRDMRSDLLAALDRAREVK